MQLLCEQNPFHESPDSQFTWCCCSRKQFGKMSFLAQCASALIGLIQWGCVVYHFVSELSFLLIYGNSRAMFSIHASVKDFGLVYGDQTSSSCYSYCPTVSCKKIWRYLQHSKFSRCAKWKVKCWAWLLLSEICHFCWATLINTVKRPIINQALQLTGADLVGQTFYDLAMLTSFDSITFKVTDLFVTIRRFLGH